MPTVDGAGPQGAAYALEVSLPLMVPWAEWPGGDSPDALPAQDARVWLGSSQRALASQCRGGPRRIRRFVFRKHLAAESQPFDLVAERSCRVADLRGRRCCCGC